MTDGDGTAIPSVRRGQGAASPRVTLSDKSGVVRPRWDDAASG